ncbi:MAG: hypothetical protein ACOH1X_06535 [Kaistella sp.]
MKIPFICVNYNTAQESIKYIQNVKSISKNDEALVIIVDNSPLNNDFEFLSTFIRENHKDDKNIILLKKENKGYFQGLNEGIRYAKDLGISNSFYVVGNNDIIFKKDFINQLNKITLNDDVLVLAPDVITTDYSHENPHVINKMSFLRKLKYDVYFLHYGLAKYLSKIKSVDRRNNSYDPVRKEIHMGIGALYVLTPRFFHYFEKLSEEVFLFGEEAILAGQINSVNGKILYEPNLVCHHNESATTSQMETRSKYEIIRKSFKIYRKYL